MGHGKTRGAYDVLSDLVMEYSPKHYVLYTFGRDDVLDLAPNLGEFYAGDILKRLKK